MKRILPLLLVVLVACSKYGSDTPPAVKPNAMFSFSGDSAFPDPVVFTNLSTSATPFRWSFGDGSFLESLDNNPVSHAYADGGTYTVTLTSYSATDSAVYTKTVTVLPVKTHLLGISFTSTPDSNKNYFIDTMPVQVVLNLRASGSVQYKVDYGDGTTDTVLQHQYKAGAGMYHVSVQVLTKYGNDTLSGSVELFTIGEKKYGGVIFHTDNTGHGLVAAESIFTTSLNWGCDSTLLNVTDSAVGSGYTNTQTIIDSCGNSTVAYFCTQLTINGYTGWYLPSIFELRVLAAVSGRSMADGYVSSTEHDATTYLTDLPPGTGMPVTASKTNTGSFNVIPVRRF